MDSRSDSEINHYIIVINLFQCPDQLGWSYKVVNRTWETSKTFYINYSPNLNLFMFQSSWKIICIYTIMTPPIYIFYIYHEILMKRWVKTNLPFVMHWLLINQVVEQTDVCNLLHEMFFLSLSFFFMILSILSKNNTNKIIYKHIASQSA